jgi:hypothetical protein
MGTAVISDGTAGASCWRFVLAQVLTLVTCTAVDGFILSAYLQLHKRYR